MSDKDYMPKKVLVVDNDQAFLNRCAAICEKHQINVVKAANWEAAIYHFNQAKFDVAIVSLTLEGMTGLVLLQKWRHHEVESKRECSFILAMGQRLEGTANALAQELDDTMWIKKPVTEPALLVLFSKLAAAKAQKEQVTQLRDQVIAPLLKSNNTAELEHMADTKLKSMGTRGKEMAAEVFESIKEIDKAVGQYRELHDDHPQNMRYINEVGRLEMQRGNLNEAKQAYETADKNAPMQMSRLMEMAKLYIQTGEPDAAVEKMKAIIDGDPSEPDKKYDMFELLQESGYEKHAQELCQSTTAPLELIRYYNNRGVFYSKDEDYQSAINEYSKAEKLIPQSKELYRILYNKAIAHINLKDHSSLVEAEKLLKRCLHINKKFEKAEDKLKIVADYLAKVS